MRLILALIVTALLALAALSAQGAAAEEADLGLRRSMGNLRPSQPDLDLRRSMGNRRPLSSVEGPAPHGNGANGVRLDDVIGPRHPRKHRYHGHRYRPHYYPPYGHPYYVYPPYYGYRYPYYAPIYIPAETMYGPQALKRFLGVP